MQEALPREAQLTLGVSASHRLAGGSPLERLGAAVWQSKCNTVSKKGGEAGDIVTFLNRQEGDDDMAYRQLTQDERYAMADMLHLGYSYRRIGYVPSRSPSTICREQIVGRRRVLQQHTMSKETIYRYCSPWSNA